MGEAGEGVKGAGMKEEDGRVHMTLDFSTRRVLRAMDMSGMSLEIQIILTSRIGSTNMVNTNAAEIVRFLARRLAVWGTYRTHCHISQVTSSVTGQCGN